MVATSPGAWLASMNDPLWDSPAVSVCKKITWTSKEKNGFSFKAFWKDAATVQIGLSGTSLRQDACLTLGYGDLRGT